MGICERPQLIEGVVIKEGVVVDSGVVDFGNVDEVEDC